ncbi:guanylate kinase [Ignavibacteria bacterium]|nr:guanylate kinase [Bacteroidota bacterium]MCZ2132422.1 guanylate kinase [Bacteroidota bacterium]
MLLKKLIVLSAPSGGGKTTVARHLLAVFPELRFSVSATTRPIRAGEVFGKDYFFLTKQEFEQKIADGDLLEYEEIFGNLYGTLRSETQRALGEGRPMLFDVDVKGALSIRRAFPDDSLLLFIAPPDAETLKRRLQARNTESEEQIQIRLSRTEMEMQLIGEFDIIIVNDDLHKTLAEAEQAITAE